MPREDQLPEEATPIKPEEEPVEEAPVLPEDAPADAPDEPDAAPEEAEEADPVDVPESTEEPIPDPPTEDDPEARAIASAEDQPQDQTQQTRECTTPEQSTPSRKKGRSPHPLWRGWWLAVILLGIAVLMGRIDVFGVAWRRQPWRAFGGAVAAGGFLAALPGLIRHDLPERPRLRQCLLGLLLGLIWGVLG